MDLTVLLVALVLLGATAAALFVVMRQLQRGRVAEAAASERLQAREAELSVLRSEFAQLQLDYQSLGTNLQNAREENATLRANLDFERKRLEETQTFVNESKVQLAAAFKNIANEIFDDKSQKFKESNRESLVAVLSPLQEKIQRFEKQVADSYQKESNERFSLKREIENLQALNSRISEDAVNLTNALKGDNKAQGNWGEFVLESLLEHSGLVKGREYEVQVSLKAEDGSKSQPDVVVHLPESRDLIIDSKVSLKAWDALTSATEESERGEQLKLHLLSIRNHIKALSAKDYQNLIGVNTLDYVVLFMPIEAAFSVALQQDGELFQFAFERNIIIVGPTTLLTTLKTVQNLWRLVQQNQNAAEIATQAGNLYDKFVGFVADLEEVGSRIDASKKSFDKAHNKLHTGRGNLVRRVEVLRELGAKTSKKQSSELVSSALDGEETVKELPASHDDESSSDAKTRH